MNRMSRIAVVALTILAFGVTPILVACSDSDSASDTRMAKGVVSAARTAAMVNRARVQMDVFSQSIQLHYLNHRRLPATLDVLAEADPQVGEPYMESIPEDPWGNPYAYRQLDGRKFTIQCAGPDGVMDTDDDLYCPRLEDE